MCLAFSKMHPAEIPILIGLTDRDRFFPGRPAEEPFEVGRVRTGAIDTEREVNRSMFLEIAQELGGVRNTRQANR
jgi:hypothetical protein